VTLGEATAAADTAARAAGVGVRDVRTVAELVEVTELFDAIWRRAANPPLTTELLRALATAGSYVVGAYDGAELVGACVGFFAAPAAGSLHSHIAGVSPAARGRHVGFALKLHQRAWALQRGVTEVTWTFDPLVARNAWFNTGKLGAQAVEYLPDHYGGMRDEINGDDATDRLLVRWDLRAPRVVAACRGESHPADAVAERARGAVVALGPSATGGPVASTTDGPVVLVAVPPDVEALRRTDPALAAHWRSAVRDALHPLLADGGRVTGFDRAGWYVLERRPAGPPNVTRAPQDRTAERTPWS